MYWLTMGMSQQVRAKKLFPAFRKYLDRTDNSVEEIVREHRLLHIHLRDYI